MLSRFLDALERAGCAGFLQHMTVSSDVLCNPNNWLMDVRCIEDLEGQIACSCRVKILKEEKRNYPIITDKCRVLVRGSR